MTASQDGTPRGSAASAAGTLRADAPLAMKVADENPSADPSAIGLASPTDMPYSPLVVSHGVGPSGREDSQLTSPSSDESGAAVPLPATPPAGTPPADAAGSPAAAAAGSPAAAAAGSPAVAAQAPAAARSPAPAAAGSPAAAAASPPAPRRAGNDDPTRTRTRDSNDSDSPSPLTSRPPLERLPAPLQYRDPQRYQIVAEHGRGGLGRVYRARDKELGRDVALKELLHRGTSSELRFFREALITARLEHPGIVPIHEAGRWPDGTPFYAMKLVAGRPLKELIDDCKTLEDRLALLPNVIAVADAIAYAHDHKIIHRDLKPSNVIVGEFGETVVIDWGLAKDIAAGPDDPAGDPTPDGPYRKAPADDGVTVAGTILGTPAYMSPEQARGEPVDERADVYAIGAMLYQLCTGAALHRDHVRHAVKTMRANRIETDLVAIVVKATAEQSEARHTDARALSVDLHAFAAGARILSRHYSLFALLEHWLRRHRRAAIISLAISVVAFIAASWSIATILNERDRARDAQIKAEFSQQRERSARATAEQERDHALISEAALLLAKDPTLAKTLLDSNRINPSAERDTIESRVNGSGTAHSILSYSPYIVIDLQSTRGSPHVLVSTSDRRLHLANLDDGTTQVIATRLMEPSPTIRAQGAWVYGQNTDDGPRLQRTPAVGPSVDLSSLPQFPQYSAAIDDDVLLLDQAGRLHSTKMGAALQLRDGVRGMATLGASDLLLCTVGGHLETLREPRRQLGRCKHNGMPSNLATSGEDYVALRNDKNMIISHGRGKRTVDFVTTDDYQLSMSSSGLVAAVDSRGQPWLVMPGAGAAVSGPPSDVMATSVATDGSIAAWGYTDGTIHVVDTETNSVWTFIGHRGLVAFVLIDSATGTLTSVGGPEIRRWRLRPGLGLSTLPMNCTPFNIVARTTGGAAAVDCRDGSVSLVEPFADEIVHLHKHQDLSFKPSWLGSRVCSGGWDGQLICTDTNTHRTEIVAKHKEPIPWSASPPDGELLAYLVSDGSVWSYDGIRRTLLYKHASEPYRLVFSPDARSIASTDQEGVLSTFGLTDRSMNTSRVHRGFIFALDWSANGLRTSSSDATMVHWSRDLRPLAVTQASGPLREFVVHRDTWLASKGFSLWLHTPLRDYEFKSDTRIADISQSPSGRYAIAVSAGEVMVFDLEDFRIATIQVHDADLLCARFMTDDIFGICGVRGILWGRRSLMAFSSLFLSN